MGVIEQTPGKSTVRDINGDICTTEIRDKDGMYVVEVTRNGEVVASKEVFGRIEAEECVDKIAYRMTRTREAWIEPMLSHEGYERVVVDDGMTAENAMEDINEYNRGFESYRNFFERTKGEMVDGAGRVYDRGSREDTRLNIIQNYLSQALSKRNEYGDYPCDDDGNYVRDFDVKKVRKEHFKESAEQIADKEAEYGTWFDGYSEDGIPMYSSPSFLMRTTITRNGEPCFSAAETEVLVHGDTDAVKKEISAYCRRTERHKNKNGRKIGYVGVTDAAMSIDRERSIMYAFNKANGNSPIRMSMSKNRLHMYDVQNEKSIEFSKKQKKILETGTGAEVSAMLDEILENA